MLDWLEDEELEDNMLSANADTPRKEPKLSELEAVRIRQVLAAEAVFKSLMVSGGNGRELITLEDLLHRPEWQRRAACRGVGTEAFFPVRGGSSHPARAICGTCEVRQECLDDAIANGDKFGIWGGTSERQRRQMRPARRSVA